MARTQGKRKRLQRRKISSVGSTRLEKEISGGFADRNEVKNVNTVKICYILFYILINLCISVMSVIQQQYNVNETKAQPPRSISLSLTAPKAITGSEHMHNM